MNPVITPRETLEDSLQYWWLVVVMMILGAGVGWITHTIQPPVYEAHASIATSIDFTRSGFLTDIEEDYALTIVGDVLSSQAVLQIVLDQLGDEGKQLEIQALRQMMTLERQNNTWIYRVRHDNPAEAEHVSRLLAQAGYETVRSALHEALLAESLARYVDSLVSCLEQSAAVQPVAGNCSPASLPNIQEELKPAVAMMHRHRIASQGILPAMTFALPNFGAAPTSPVLYGRDLLMLAGALTGLLAAIWLMYLRLPQRILRKATRD
ncbi:MAG: hypothetical protein U1B80_02975 [Anaerolineaceae bacterium]|nr:hypothetical protein [Anaerolineaceae bacterium]